MVYCDFIAGTYAGKKKYKLKLCNKFKLNTIFFLYEGACTIFLTHPLDTIKTNMQSGNMRFTKATMVVYRAEGVRHLICFKKNYRHYFKLDIIFTYSFEDYIVDLHFLYVATVCLIRLFSALTEIPLD